MMRRGYQRMGQSQDGSYHQTTEQKVENGADFAITQMIFDADAYADYVKQLKERGIDIPIIPGIRPVTKVKHVKVAEEIFKANVPDSLKKALEGLGPQEAREVCIDFSVALCQKLKKMGAPGIHLFTLNDISVVADIISRI